MLANIDKAQVGATVTAIEGMDDDKIGEVVNACRVPEPEKSRIKNGLIGRRAKVRGRMKSQGWLD